MDPDRLIVDKGLEEYFFGQIRGACSNQKIAPSPHTEFYLVRLLTDFCHRDCLLPPQWDSEQALAIQYLECLQSQDQEKRLTLLKQLGDFTLYTTGFFQESLQRHGMDLNYYFSLGCNAYAKLHLMADQAKVLEAFQETFAELANQFPNFVEVLCEISENSKIARDSDLLRLYERWLVTGSKRILKKLQEEGIHPLGQPSSHLTH